MTTGERLKGLKAWTASTLCAGREMKAPGARRDISEIVRAEPKCYLGWAPSRMTRDGILHAEAETVCPGILIMPNQAYAKLLEEKRFDRYSNIHRPQELGGQLNVCMLFSVYEPGERLEGFAVSVGEKGAGADMSLLLEGTEQGLLTLLDWMDECKAALLGAKSIPGTDLAVVEETITYSLLTDQSYIVDRRPIYYGFINAGFTCYAEEKPNEDFLKLLQ